MERKITKHDSSFHFTTSTTAQNLNVYETIKLFIKFECKVSFTKVRELNFFDFNIAVIKSTRQILYIDI